MTKARLKTKPALPPPFKQARSRVTHGKIFKAARDEFSTHGFHGARIDRMAAAAGVNKQRIYAYFHSKARLFAEVLKSAYNELVAEEKKLFTRLEHNGHHDLGAILFDHYTSFHLRHPHFWRLLAWENLAGGRHAQVLKGLRSETLARLRGLYRQGQEAGAYRDDVEPDTFIFAVMAIIFFHFSNRKTMSQTLNRNLGDPKVRDRLLGEILKILAV